MEGIYIGSLSADQRILRRRTMDKVPARRPPPVNPPGKSRLPGSIPLPPQMAELSYEFIDILEESPEQLHTVDTGEFRPDAE